MIEKAGAVDLFAFDNSYARLPDRFFARVQPTPIVRQGWLRFFGQISTSVKWICLPCC